MKANLIALAVSLLIGALFMEGVLRTLYDPAPIWIEPQVRHQRSPLLGWVLPPNTNAYSIDAPVRINSLGIRDDEFEVEKPPGEYRILSLGDSFTFALGVRFEDLYVQQLERTLREHWDSHRFQVINAGVAGYNTRQELIYLLARGIEFRPDLISVGFYWNDLSGNDRPLPDLATVPMRAPDAEDYDREPDRALPNFVRDSLRRSLLLYLSVTRAKAVLSLFRRELPEATRIQRALLYGDYETLEPLWSATAGRLLEIAEVGRAHGIPVVLLAFPMENQLHGDFPKMVYSKRLSKIWEPTGFPFVDLEPLYRDALAEGVNPFLPYDRHPNRAGMQIAAEAIFQAIEQGNLLPALHSAP